MRMDDAERVCEDACGKYGKRRKRKLERNATGFRGRIVGGPCNRDRARNRTRFARAVFFSPSARAAREKKAHFSKHTLRRRRDNSPRPRCLRSGARAARSEAGRRLVGRDMVLICVVCRGEDFDETEEGFYVCHLCGTQSQDVVREVEDEEIRFNTAGAGITRGARRIRTPSRHGDARGTTPGADPRGGTYGPTPAGPGSRVTAQFRNADASENASPESRAALDRVVAYCDGVQRLLRTQCDALVETLGFPEAIRAETRAVWLAYLDGSRILETDFADPDTFVEDSAAADEKDETRARQVRAERGSDDRASSSSSGDATSSESQSRDGGTDDEDRPGEIDPRERRRRRVDKNASAGKTKGKKRVTFRAFVTRRFPVRCTLAAVYLACLRLRLPVHCGDITRWAADGRLPFLAESARVADAVAAREPEPSANGFAATSRRRNADAIPRSVDVAARTVAARFAAPLATALVARSVPKTHVVAVFAARMARVAERSTAESRVAFPPTNAAAFVERFVGALGLGGAFQEQAMRALCLYQAPGLRYTRVSRAGAALPLSSSDPNEGGTKPRREGGVPAPPHAHAAATVVAAMKAAYDLSTPAEAVGSSGGESGSTGSETLDEARRRWRLAVTARAESTTREGFRATDHASSRTEAAGRLAPACADAFLAFCRDHVFGGRSVVPPPRDRVVANLWRAYETSREEEPAEPETAPRRGAGDGFAPPPFRKKARVGETSTRGGADAYWRGPTVLADAPRAYRAVVETVAALAHVAPETLHACVLDVDTALEARERCLRGEMKRKELKPKTAA